jgi:hypothetical protein
MKKKTFFLCSGNKYSFLAGLLALSLVDLCQLSIPLIIEKVVDALTVEGAGMGDISKYGLICSS